MLRSQIVLEGRLPSVGISCQQKSKAPTTAGTMAGGLLVPSTFNAGVDWTTASIYIFALAFIGLRATTLRRGCRTPDGPSWRNYEGQFLQACTATVIVSVHTNAVIVLGPCAIPSVNSNTLRSTRVLYIRRRPIAQLVAFRMFLSNL